uniref:EARLY FLOWERING 3 n=1 Tax=Dimocarpus longan TaxID=128017 RepID=A0A088PY80_9ROSI|nr:EARLY FLOWERING 3 [Dimocarpus longan]
MKRGKDDEKIMGPMFPRLHVNDTEKGGPRAPPRNKMALYEQLSIPTQRFNPAVLPPNPSNSSSLVPPGSSSQGSGPERNVPFPISVPHKTPSRLTEKFHARQSAGSTLTIPLPQLEQRKKAGDEDDFTVPVYVHSGKNQNSSKTHNGVDGGKLSPYGPPYPGHSLKSQNVYDNDPKRSSLSDLNLRQEARHQSEENPNTNFSSRDHSLKPSATLSSREKIDGLVKEASASPIQESRDLPESHFNRPNDNDTSLRPETRTRSQPVDRRCGDGVESMRDINKGVVHQSRSGSHSREDNSCPIEPDIDSEYREEKTCGSLQLGDRDKSDAVSETSMVDSISGLDISPDDVVGIIGQKHFWKARKAIANQQRVFAVQVFELHRLIKVQQLIAGSPQLLLEDSAYLGKASLNSSPAKKFPSEYVVKPLPHIVKRKDDFEKPKHNMECSAENAVGKMSVSSVKNGSQPSNYGSYLANPPAASVASDSRMAPWYFHQSPGQQWLIPVMSPSEGLIYKPYPGPGFMGPVCGGGCGPFGPTPIPGNFMHPAYGVPAPHTHQGIGAMPGAHPVGHGYFPPYGMPIMNQSVSSSAAEQKNQSAGPGSLLQNGLLSGGGANFNVQHESSCNVPTQKKGAIPQAMQFQASKDMDVQGSTASSTGERMQHDETGATAEGQEAQPHFSMASVPPQGAPQPQDTEQPTRVIRVVPHNPRSATESVARIFQSIQEERKQYDSI